MALLDISRVTRTLVTLLELRLTAYGVGFSFAVTPQPASEPVSEPNVLRLYLYHLSQNGHVANLPPPGQDQPPVRYTPMGLDLHYQITADSKDDVYNAQQLMGLAVKALRDYPVIDDSTQVPDTSAGPDEMTPVLDAELRGNGNRLRIFLEPIQHTDAVSFWTAGSSPLRLAAYYQVSVVLLEPEESRLRPGRVLRYGAFTFPSLAPRLDGTRNTLYVVFPGAPQPDRIELRPAQVPFVDPSSADSDQPKNGDIEFVGSGLSGDRSALLLRNPRWDTPVEVDASWKVKATSDRVTATLPPAVSSVAGRAVLPGVHSALVRTTTRRTLSDDSVADVSLTSNEVPFVITPRVDAVADDDPDPGAVVEVKGWLFADPETDGDERPLPVDVQVLIGSRALRRTSSDPPAPQEFVVVDPRTLRLVRPAGLSEGSPLPLRVLTNGAEAPPQWIRMP